MSIATPARTPGPAGGIAAAILLLAAPWTPARSAAAASPIPAPAIAAAAGAPAADVVPAASAAAAATGAPAADVVPTASAAAAATAAPAATGASAPAGPAALTTAEKPYSKLPYSPSLDPASIDRSVDPCADLYTYSCGIWQQDNPIPADQSGWSVYDKMQQDNQRYLWGILQQASVPAVTRTPEQQKIGDYFAACMNVEAAERAGIAPLRADLARIDALSSKAQLTALLGDLQLRTRSGGLLFGWDVEQDERDARKMIAALDPGGLGLPDRDYYLKQDPKSQQIRARYQAHVASMLGLLQQQAGPEPGDSRPVAAQAVAIMQIETALAAATLSAADSRDPHQIYHRTALAQLMRQVPAIDWPTYFRLTGLSPQPWVNLSETAFFDRLNQLIGQVSLADLKIYLRWQLLAAWAPYLSNAFVQEDFDFNRAYLLGVKSQPPRWRTCVEWVDRDLGDALGKVFVDRTFPALAHLNAVRMTRQIEAAMKKRIQALKWMSAGTRARALAKLAAVSNRIGYPTVWRDYSTLIVQREDLFGNVARAASFESRREAAKIGLPVDRSEWQMTAPTVDAYYDSQLNAINFPAGVLMPPLFDARMDDAPNYGDTGGTIGHELTHAFDDDGRQFDGAGNLRDWWTPADAKGFQQRAQCIVDQFSGYTAVDDMKVDGKFTLGENIADLGGELLAWMAWQAQTHDMQLKDRDGLTPAQRFFVGFAQWACANERPERMRADVINDPHPPPKYRINGVVVNMPEFARAFHCKAGQALVKSPQDTCRIW